jgi:hypothetical protein
MSTPGPPDRVDGGMVTPQVNDVLVAVITSLSVDASWSQTLFVLMLAAFYAVGYTITAPGGTISAVFLPAGTADREGQEAGTSRSPPAARSLNPRTRRPKP